MREVHFHKQNIEKWKDFEKQISDKSSLNPDILADLFIKVTDDLSYARTYFPNSTTTKYLNGLATAVHQRIYRNKREKSGRFISFWTIDVPLAAWRIRKPILYSLIIFAISLLIAIISESRDKNFVSMILGDDYIQTTRDNVAKKDPLGIYKSGSELYSFIWIVVNNLRVDLITFAFGLFFSLGTVMIIFKNGVMLGAFEYMLMYDMNVKFNDALPIWVHGTFEISAMIIAGGAGMALGNSILFPKSHSRLISFKNAAVQGAIVLVGILPLTFVAAFFEGFVTRHSEMPIALCWLIILAQLTFVIFYFVIYPAKIHKLYEEEPLSGLTQIQGVEPSYA